MTKTVLIFDKDAEWYCRQLAAAYPDHDYCPARSEAEAIAHAARAEVLCALAPRITAELVAAMPRLEWIHALTTGVDNLLLMKPLGREVAITNSRGIHGPQMSELAMLLMMAAARRLPAMIHNQGRARWERWPQPLLQDKTVCIVGLGAIAEALAPRCAAFGMHIIGVSDGRSSADGFERIFPRAQIATAATEADFVVVVVPYSQQTHHLIDGTVLAAMKPAAILVNIARGGCVDEKALLAHLQAGRIAAAALDVFETEPLPPDSPFWALPNVVITPHIGGMSDIYHQQALPLVAANLTAYANGGVAALSNIVKRQG